MSDAQFDGSEAPRQFITTWAQAMSKALSQIAGSACDCNVLPALPESASTASENDVWVITVFSGSIRGEMAFRLCSASAVPLAHVFVGEPPDSSGELVPEHREALLELFRQIGGLVASAIRSTQAEVQLRVESSAAAPSWSASSVAWLGFGESLSSAWIEVHLSAALMASLRPEAALSPEQTTRVPDVVGREGKVSLDLLMDVELGVTLRFGSRRLLLREILDLNPGSVLALDRQVQEPADMLLDGRVVARGEVVVVNGNYGLRVTEIGPAMGIENGIHGSSFRGIRSDVAKSAT